MLVVVCNLLKMNLIASKSIMEGQLAHLKIDEAKVPGVNDNVARHLQITRSMPVRSLISTLVGMKSPENIKKNMQAIKKGPLSKEEFHNALSR